MLGRILLQKQNLTNGHNGFTNGTTNGTSAVSSSKNWRSAFEEIDWVNPNEKNLVADGESYTHLRLANLADLAA